MKPTAESIQAAFDTAAHLDIAAHTTMLQLASGKVAFQCGNPETAVEFLEAAKKRLLNSRHTQLEALEHIEEALNSART